MGFKLNEKTMAVLKNFSQINPQIYVEAGKIEVINGAYSSLGCFIFDEPLPIKDGMGLYEVNEFIAIMSAYKNPEITQHDGYIIISDGNLKTKYHTTARTLMPKVLIQQKYSSDDIRNRMGSLGAELEFVLPAEKLNFLLKMANLTKAEFMFFESDGDKIRITVGDALESSGNTHDVTIDADIKTNCLKTPVKCNMAEFKLLPADYTAIIASKGLTYWKSDLGIEYFIGCTTK
jgi:hypothetical protein